MNVPFDTIEDIQFNSNMSNRYSNYWSSDDIPRRGEVLEKEKLTLSYTNRNELSDTQEACRIKLELVGRKGSTSKAVLLAISPNRLYADIAVVGIFYGLAIYKVSMLQLIGTELITEDFEKELLTGWQQKEFYKQYLLFKEYREQKSLFASILDGTTGEGKTSYAGVITYKNRVLYLDITPTPIVIIDLCGVREIPLGLVGNLTKYSKIRGRKAYNTTHDMVIERYELIVDSNTSIKAVSELRACIGGCMVCQAVIARGKVPITFLNSLATYGTSRWTGITIALEPESHSIIVDERVTSSSLVLWKLLNTNREELGDLDWEEVPTIRFSKSRNKTGVYIYGMDGEEFTVDLSNSCYDKSQSELFQNSKEQVDKAERYNQRLKEKLGL